MEKMIFGMGCAVIFLAALTFVWFIIWLVKGIQRKGYDIVQLQSQINQWKKELSIINEKLQRDDLRMIEKEELRKDQVKVEKIIAKLEKLVGASKGKFQK